MTSLTPGGLLSPQEQAKQRAEVEAWRAMVAAKGSGFLQEPVVAGDLSVYTDSTILDIGCGPRPFVEQFPTHAGFMLDCCMTAYAENGLLQPSSVASTFCADVMAESLPIQSGVADHVFALNMLDHTFNPEAVVAEFTRVLKPWGCVHLHVDLGGKANPCEPVVFMEEDIQRLFAGFEVIYAQDKAPSNPTRDSMLVRIYRKPKSPGIPQSLLAVPHGDRPERADDALERSKYLRFLMCVRCGSSLVESAAGLACDSCSAVFPVRYGVANLIRVEDKAQGEVPARA